MVFRLLYTLEKCGLVEKVGANLYQSCVRPLKHRLYRLGYAAQGTDYQFSKEVSASLQRAAAAEGIELICFDTRYSAKVAQRNADLMVREKVDLAIEFQTDEDVAPIVAAKYREANIPMIAIDIPPSRRDLLRRQQLRSRSDRRPLSRTLGERKLGRRRR